MGRGQLRPQSLQSLVSLASRQLRLLAPLLPQVRLPRRRSLLFGPGLLPQVLRGRAGMLQLDLRFLRPASKKHMNAGHQQRTQPGGQILPLPRSSAELTACMLLPPCGQQLGPRMAPALAIGRKSAFRALPESSP